MAGSRGWAFVADLTPLRHSPDYRRLWTGLTVGQLGQQMSAVVVAIQVYDITRSSFAVGLVGGFAVVPLVVAGLYGGALVDAMDRRRLALVASAGLWTLSLVLVVQAVLGLREVWLLYAVVAGQSAFFAVNNPARQAIVPRLLPPALLPAANALTTVSFNLGFTVGPVLGGVLAAGGRYALAYGVDALLFLVALWALWRLPPMPPQGPVRRAGLASVMEGLSFLRGRTALWMTFAVDLCAMVLAQPRALFPEIADRVLGGGSRTVGLLQAAPAIGALVAGVSSGWLSRVRRQGLAVIACVVAYGASVAAFGLAGSLAAGVVFLALSGAFDMVSAAFRSTILQVAAPDDMRGRLQGVFIVVVAGGPRMGDVVAGSAGTLLGPTSAVVAGGVACMAATALLALRFRDLARYRPPSA